MAETHILQHIVSFALAMWWTERWLMHKLVSRWRFVLSTIASTLLWVIVAFTATNAIDVSSGVTIAFSSTALSYFAAFMAFLSFASTFLGLYLWTAEEAVEMSEDLPEQLRSNLGD